MNTSGEHETVAKPHKQQESDTIYDKLGDICDDKKRLEDEPSVLRFPGNVKIHVNFTRHFSAEDAQELKGKIVDADVIVPEYNGVPDRDKRLYQQTADGDVGAKNTLKMLQGTQAYREFHREEIDNLFDTQKVVLFADLEPEEDKNLQQLLAEHPLGDVSGLDGPSRVDSYLGHKKKWAQSQIDREDKIIDRLKSRLTELVENNPTLKDQPEVNVVITMGAVHTRMFHELRRQNAPVSREMQRPITTYDYSNELLRKLEFGIEPDEELVKKAFIDEVLASHSKTQPNEVLDNSETARTREFIDGLSDEQRDYIIANFDVLDGSEINEARSYMYKVLDVYEDYVYRDRRVPSIGRKAGVISPRGRVLKAQKLRSIQPQTTINQADQEEARSWF